MSLFQELKRRRVFRAAAIYAVAAWAVIQVADTVAPRIGLPDWVVTFVIFIAAMGFPLVIVVAWLFERTPEGLRRTPDLRPITGRSRAVGYIGLGMLMGLVLFGAYWRLQPHDTANEEYANSVAVLPFTDMSPNKDQEYFGDGITEEILNVLAQIPGLRVPARTSSFSFKGKDLAVRDIANQLGVANVLQGSIRKSGDQVRITAQLIDARTDRHIWSEQFDRNVNDLFAVQGEIARAIVDALQLHIATTTVVDKDTDSPDAHEHYLKGLYYWHRRHSAELPQGLDQLRAAVREDSNYAKAWAGLALMYAIIPQYTQFDVTMAIREGKAAAKRALELDPASSDAHAALGQIAQELEWDWKGAAEHLERANALNSRNAKVHQWRAELSLILGNYDEALAEIDRALELDPLSSVMKTVRGANLLRLGRGEESVALLREVVASDPGYLPGRGNLIMALLRTGNVDDAIRVWPDSEPMKVTIEAVKDSTKRKAALQELAKLRTRDPRHSVWPATFLYVALGEADSAANVVLQGANTWAPSLGFWARDPFIVEKLGSKPEFQEFLRKVNL